VWELKYVKCLGGSSVIWLKIWKPKKIQSLPKVIDTAFYPIIIIKIIIIKYYVHNFLTEWKEVVGGHIPKWKNLLYKN
jgi:hypothetical protein